MTPDAAATLPTLLMVTAIILAAVSGLPFLAGRPGSAAAQRFSAGIMVAAAAAGIVAAVLTLLQRISVTWEVAWPLPFGPTRFGLDPLSALVSLPLLLIAACCSIYGIDYWPAAANRRTAGRLSLFFGLLVAALLGVLMARSAGLFLLTWEVMALAAYFVLICDDHQAEVRDAGTVYLICTHAGTLALFALFALLKKATGSFLFPVIGSIPAVGPLAVACYVLILLGFGFKAGLMPLHVWLPGAHANAPSHISAFMSGVILKIGIYGIIRLLSFFTGIPLWWGVLLLCLGIASGILGVAFALGQHDIKRLLAYHSIENIGIIVMGIGVALIGRSCGSPVLILLGMAGALLHLVNHGLFKSLLFLGAGSVIHGTGSRNLERMGGLLRRQPWTGLAFLTGAVAICGLPPLNGFVSEWLLYLGFFHGVTGQTGAGAVVNALAAPSLALIGGLAIACFVKVVGVAFLGAPRSREAAQAHESGLLIRLPMGLLALCCLTIGLAPRTMAPLLDGAVATWLPASIPLPLLTALAPFGWLTILALVLLTFILGGAAWLHTRLSPSAATSVPTWGCGYQAPTGRMQYSASSFAGMLVALFAVILHPEQHRSDLRGPFPAATRFASHLPETTLERLYLPLLTWANGKCGTLRRLQHGQLHLYILYTFLTLVVLLTVSLS